MKIHPTIQTGFMVQDCTVSRKSIEEACEHLYLHYRFNPHFLVVSQEGHNQLLEEVNALHLSESVRVTRLNKVVNPITGSLLNLIISDIPPQGTMLFGKYPLEERPTSETLSLLSACLG